MNDFSDIHDKCKKYTMTSVHRMHALYQTLGLIIDRGIPGDVVECGVWRGGSMMLCGMYLQKKEIKDKAIYLYDTFDGMTKPEDYEKDVYGGSALKMWEDRGNGRKWCNASLEEVMRNMSSAWEGKNIYVKGDVCETIPRHQPESIALLRLDTDFYRSTSCELNYLYPLISKGGFLIIDDYGWWTGSRKATLDYFGTINGFRNVDGSCIIQEKKK